MTRHRFTFLSALFIFLLPVMAACAGQTVLPAATPTPASTAAPLSVSPQPTATTTPQASPLPTATRVPTPTPSLTPATPSAPIPVLQKIKFIDADTGWAFSVQAGRLLHTTNGGRTWMDVTPNLGYRPGGTFFLDANTAWITSGDYGTPGSGKVFRTRDGGQSWESFAVPFIQGAFQFLDATHGWIMADPDCGAGSCYVRLFQTADGGQTWTLVPLVNPNGADTLPPNSLPGTVRISSGDSFSYSDPTTLWYGGGGFVTNPYALLFVSRYNGKAWQRIEAPVPHQKPGLGMPVVVTLPVFMDPNNGYFTAVYEGVSQPGEPQDSVSVMAVYWTHDGGRTWTPAAGLARNTGWRGSVQFFSPRDGFATCGKVLCVTHDAGQTWQANPANIELNANPDRALIAFSFVDASTGWALVGAADGSTLLYQTVDGGVTWNRLNPTLAAAANSQPRTTINAQTAGMVINQVSWGKGTVLEAEFSPDGKRLGVVATLGVYLYDAENFKQLRFTPGGAGFTTAAFSPGWKRLALGVGTDITLMGLDEPASLQTLSTRQGAVTGLLFSPDGAYLASLVRPPGEEVYTLQVELWQVNNGQRVAAWDAGALPQVAFSADGKVLYAWNPFRMAGLRRWEIPSGLVLTSLDTLNPYSLAFSPDGRRMADYDVTDSSGTIIIQPVGGGPQQRVSGGKPGPSGLLRFSPDSSLLASFLSDGTVQVYKASDGSLVSSFSAGSASQAFLAFSPDSANLALPTPDGVAIYAVSSGQPLRTELPVPRLRDHFGTVRQAAISPQGDRAAAVFDAVDANQGSLAVWHLPEGRLEYLFPNLGALTLAWSPDGQRLAVAGWDGKIKILPAAGGAIQMTLAGHSEQVQSLAWSPDGAWLASTAMQSLKLWRAADGSLGREIAFQDGWVTSARFSSDSALVAAVSASGKNGVWQVSDGKQVAELPGGVDRQVGLDFAPGGTFLAIGEPTRITLWHLDKSELFQVISTGPVQLAAMRLSPDGALIAGGFLDGSILLWQATQGTQLRNLPGGVGAVTSLDFSADGRLLLAAGRDGTFRVFAVKG